MTLTALWIAHTNTITLDANGGTVSQSSVPVIYEQPYTLPTPTLTGYTFVGWFTEEEVQYTNGTWMEFEDVVLIAKWTASTYTVTYNDTQAIRNDVVVTLDYNYSGTHFRLITLKHGQILSRPTDPVRKGYIFIDWYTDSSCTTRYEFTGTITDDMTLYAKWIRELTNSNVFSSVQINPADYYASSRSYSASIDGTSSSRQMYIYLVAQEAGTHTIYWKNSRPSNGFYLIIYNRSTGTEIKVLTASETKSESYSGISFTCAAGNIIEIRIYRGSTAEPGHASFYFSGFSNAVSTATANCMVSACTYDTESSYEDVVEYDENYTLPIPTRTGYTFGGWYNGDTKIESGVWNYTTDMTLTALWIEDTNSDQSVENGEE